MSASESEDAHSWMKRQAYPRKKVPYFEALMSKAVESIVRGYVQLKDGKALKDLLTHRQKLLDGLNRVSGIAPSLLVAQIREEIARGWSASMARWRERTRIG
jgi:hypothetical protein